MKRPEAGRALFYTRDSEGRGECAPPQEVEWAIGRAKQLGLLFHGTADAMRTMMRSGQFALGDLFIDYGISGNVMDRPGLAAMRRAAMADPGVSHLLVPRRDRLFRPDDPIEALLLEGEFRKAGLSIVIRDQVLGPIRRGQRTALADLLTGLVEYDESGKFRRVLADKILRAQVDLIKLGVSTGGSPPYGMERWLAREDGTRVRKLLPGERVKWAGHHVIWWPTAEDQLAVVDRIFKLLPTTAASRIADLLTDEGIPPPEAARRATAGVWHQTTVRNIARDPIYMAVREYGKRSEGDQQRFTPAGPRDLADGDYGATGKLRTVTNPPDQRVRKEMAFTPVVPPEQFRALQSVLNERSKSQSGKPRQRGTAANPLGCRVYDMNCGAPMYRLARRGSYAYTCSLYQQSDAKLCSHNSLPGPAASQFVLSCIRQRAMTPHFLKRLEARLQELAEAELGADRREAERASIDKDLKRLKHQMELAARNLALAESDAERQAVRSVFNELQSAKTELEGRLERASNEVPARRGIDVEVSKAMSGLDRFAELAASPEAATATQELFAAGNAKLYVRFETVEKGRRTMCVLTGGVLTLGAVEPPVPLYGGPTDKRIIRRQLVTGDLESLVAGLAAQEGRNHHDGPEGQVLSGNVARRTRPCT
jgi:hypothetical protein